MTKEEKELLLKDLCSRLPYGVFVKEEVQSLLAEPIIYTYDYHPHIDKCKPYLRPMSSMTEEEKNKINTLLDIIGSPSNVTDEDGRIIDCSYECIKLIDFYNSRYLDFRGLIPMGLALEAPEDMYKNQ